MHYRATDFGVTQPAPSAPVAAAPEPPPLPPPIWNRETRRVLASLGAAVGTAMIALVALWPRPPLPGPTELIIASLAQDGYEAARVTRLEDNGDCADPSDLAFHWSAPGAEGLACLREGGPVRFSVDRSWGVEAFAPPATPEPAADTPGA